MRRANLDCFNHNRFRILALGAVFSFMNLFGLYSTEALSDARAAGHGNRSAHRAVLDDVGRNLGSVLDAYEGEDGRTVYLVVDYHAHFDSQLKTARIMDELRRRRGVRLLGLEGGNGELNVVRFTSIADHYVRRDAAEVFVRAGYLSGVEYYAGVLDPGVDLVGLEDSELYRRNVAEFKLVWTMMRDGGEKKLEGLRLAIEALQERIWSKDAVELARAVQGHQMGTVSHDAFVEVLLTLMERHDVEITKDSEWGKVSRIREFGRSISREELKRETQALLKELETRLNSFENEKWKERALAYQTGQVRTGEYAGWVRDKAQEKGIDIAASYPNYARYTRRAVLQDSVAWDLLQDQAGPLSAKLTGKVLSGGEALSLWRLYEDYRLLSNLLHLNLRHEEWSQIEQRLDFKAFAQECERFGIMLQDSESLEAAHRRARSFYRDAARRDKVMLAKLLSAMDERSESSAVLFCGGGHAQGIAGALKEQDISYQLIVPWVEGDRETERYLTTMLEDSAIQTGAIWDCLNRVGALMLERYLTEMETSGPEAAGKQEQLEDALGKVVTALQASHALRSRSAARDQELQGMILRALNDQLDRLNRIIAGSEFERDKSAGVLNYARVLQKITGSLKVQSNGSERLIDVGDDVIRITEKEIRISSAEPVEFVAKSTTVEGTALDRMFSRRNAEERLLKRGVSSGSRKGRIQRLQIIEDGKPASIDFHENRAAYIQGLKGLQIRSNLWSDGIAEMALTRSGDREFKTVLIRDEAGNYFVAVLEGHRVLEAGLPVDTGDRKDRYEFVFVHDDEIIQAFQQRYDTHLESHVTFPGFVPKRVFAPSGEAQVMAGFIHEAQVDRIMDRVRKDPLLSHLLEAVQGRFPGVLLRGFLVVEVPHHWGGYYDGKNEWIATVLKEPFDEGLLAHELSHHIYKKLHEKKALLMVPEFRILADRIKSHFSEPTHDRLFRWLRSTPLYGERVISSEGYLRNEALAYIVGTFFGRKVVHAPSGYNLTFGDLELLGLLGLVPSETYSDERLLRGVDPQASLPATFHSFMDLWAQSGSVAAVLESPRFLDALKKAVAEGGVDEILSLSQWLIAGGYHEEVSQFMHGLIHSEGLQLSSLFEGVALAFFIVTHEHEKAGPERRKASFILFKQFLGFETALPAFARLLERGSLKPEKLRAYLLDHASPPELEKIFSGLIRFIVSQHRLADEIDQRTLLADVIGRRLTTYRVLRNIHLILGDEDSAQDFFQQEQVLLAQREPWQILLAKPGDSQDEERIRKLESAMRGEIIEDQRRLASLGGLQEDVEPGQRPPQERVRAVMNKLYEDFHLPVEARTPQYGEKAAAIRWFIQTAQELSALEGLEPKDKKGLDRFVWAFFRNHFIRAAFKDVNIADVGLDAPEHDQVNRAIRNAILAGKAQIRGEFQGKKIIVIEDTDFLAGNQRAHAGIEANAIYIAEGAYDEKLVCHEAIELGLWQKKALELAGNPVQTDWNALSEARRAELKRNLRQWMQHFPREASVLEEVLHWQAQLLSRNAVPISEGTGVLARQKYTYQEIQALVPGLFLNEGGYEVDFQPDGIVYSELGRDAVSPEIENLSSVFRGYSSVGSTRETVQHRDAAFMALIEEDLKETFEIRDKTFMLVGPGPTAVEIETLLGSFPEMKELVIVEPNRDNLRSLIRQLVGNFPEELRGSLHKIRIVRAQIENLPENAGRADFVFSSNVLVPELLNVTQAWESLFERMSDGAVFVGTASVPAHLIYAGKLQVLRDKYPAIVQRTVQARAPPPGGIIPASLTKAMGSHGVLEDSEAGGILELERGGELGGGGHYVDWINYGGMRLVRKFENYGEVDRKEVANELFARRLIKILRDRGILTKISTPAAVAIKGEDDLCLVSEYLDVHSGPYERFKEPASDVERAELFILNMVFMLEDLHPDNILRSREGLSLIDLGMIGEMDTWRENETILRLVLSHFPWLRNLEGTEGLRSEIQARCAMIEQEWDVIVTELQSAYIEVHEQLGLMHPDRERRAVNLKDFVHEYLDRIKNGLRRADVRLQRVIEVARGQDPAAAHMEAFQRRDGRSGFWVRRNWLRADTSVDLSAAALLRRHKRHLIANAPRQQRFDPALNKLPRRSPLRVILDLEGASIGQDQHVELIGALQAVLDQLSAEDQQALFDKIQRMEGGALVISSLQDCSHLFEDHQGNGFIGIHESVFDPAVSPDLRRKLLMLGLRHELAHEMAGRLTGESLARFEWEQWNRDAQFAVQAGLAAEDLEALEPVLATVPLTAFAAQVNRIGGSGRIESSPVEEILERRVRASKPALADFRARRLREGAFYRDFDLLAGTSGVSAQINFGILKRLVTDERAAELMQIFKEGDREALLSTLTGLGRQASWIYPLVLLDGETVMSEVNLDRGKLDLLKSVLSNAALVQELRSFNDLRSYAMKIVKAVAPQTGNGAFHVEFDRMDGDAGSGRPEPVRIEGKILHGGKTLGSIDARLGSLNALGLYSAFFDAIPEAFSSVERLHSLVHNPHTVRVLEEAEAHAFEAGEPFASSSDSDAYEGFYSLSHGLLKNTPLGSVRDRIGFTRHGFKRTGLKEFALVSERRPVLEMPQELLPARDRGFAAAPDSVKSIFAQRLKSERTLAYPLKVQRVLSTEGSTCTVLEGEITQAGVPKKVAIKVFHNPGSGDWIRDIDYFFNEVKGARLYADLGIGPGYYGIVDLGANPAYVMEKIEGVHPEDLGDEIFDWVTEETIEKAVAMSGRIAQQGYGMHDIQFLIVTKDAMNAEGTAARKRGDIIFMDPGGLIPLARAREDELPDVDGAAMARHVEAELRHALLHAGFDRLRHEPGYLPRFEENLRKFVRCQTRYAAARSSGQTAGQFRHRLSLDVGRVRKYCERLYAGATVAAPVSKEKILDWMGEEEVLGAVEGLAALGLIHVQGEQLQWIENLFKASRTPDWTRCDSFSEEIEKLLLLVAWREHHRLLDGESRTVLENVLKSVNPAFARSFIHFANTSAMSFDGFRIHPSTRLEGGRGPEPATDETPGLFSTASDPQSVVYSV